MLAHRRALGHRGDHGRAEVLRVRAREPDSLDPFDRVAGAQQLAELRHEGRREVAPPRVDVLAEQRDLADAVPCERLDLGEDLARPAALLPPADGRDDAVRALRVAPHRDLHPGARTPLAMHRQRRREGVMASEPASRDGEPARREPVAEVRDRSRAEGDVHERIAVEDPLPLRLGIAPADRDDEIGIPALSGGRVAEVRRQLRVRLLPDRAGVEHEHVCLFRGGRLAEPERLEHALDALRVVGVHLTAERGQVVPAHDEPV